MAAALTSAGVAAAWAALTPGRRRGLLYPVEAAKSAATRAKRIGNLTDLLALGPGPHRRGQIT